MGIFFSWIPDSLQRSIVIMRHLTILALSLVFLALAATSAEAAKRKRNGTNYFTTHQYGN